MMKKSIKLCTDSSQQYTHTVCAFNDEIIISQIHFFTRSHDHENMVCGMLMQISSEDELIIFLPRSDGWIWT